MIKTQCTINNSQCWLHNMHNIMHNARFRLGLAVQRKPQTWCSSCASITASTRTTSHTLCTSLMHQLIHVIIIDQPRHMFENIFVNQETSKFHWFEPLSMNVWWLQSLQCIGEQELQPISVPISVTEAEMCRQCLKFMKSTNFSPDCNVHSDLRWAQLCSKMQSRSN